MTPLKYLPGPAALVVVSIIVAPISSGNTYGSMRSSDTASASRAGLQRTILNSGAVAEAKRIASMKAKGNVAPTSPTGVRVVSTSISSIGIAWEAARDNVKVASYDVYVDGILRGTVKSKAYTVSALRCGTTHSISVSARDSAGNTSPKASISAGTLPCPTSAATPPSTTTPLSTTTPPSTTTTPAPQSSLPSTGGGGISPAAIVTVDTQAPSVPTRLTVSNVTGGGMTFSWSGSTDNVGVTGYAIYVNGGALGRSSVTSGTLTGLTCGTQYVLGVAAFDAAGNTSAQASLTVSTAGCPPPQTTPPITTTTTTTTAPTTSTSTMTTAMSSPSSGVPACTVTVSSNLLAALTGAAAGSTICLAGGSYAAFRIDDVAKASDVVVRPADGATVSIGQMTLNGLRHVRFTGLGGSLSVAGLDLDPNENTAAQGASDLTFDHITWTDHLNVRTLRTPANFTFDNDTFNDLAATSSWLWEGRITVRGYNNPGSVGVTISNSQFYRGCSDGIQVIGSAYGVQIGPGDEFAYMNQNGNGCNDTIAHMDAIQLYGSSHTLITGDYFHDNLIAAEAIMATGGSDHEIFTDNVVIPNDVAQRYIAAEGANTWTITHNYLGTGGTLELRSGSYGNSVGSIVRDNVMLGGLASDTDPNAIALEDYNLCPSGSAGFCTGTHDYHGTITLTGGATPTGWAGFALGTSSLGFNGASDQTSVGITP